MEQGAREAEAVTHAGGKGANLTIEVWSNSHALGSECDASANIGLRQVIHSAEEREIFAGAKAAIKAFIAASVITELASSGGSGKTYVIVGDAGLTAGGKNEGSEDAQQRGFASPIRPNDCNCLTDRDRKGNTGEGSFGGMGKGLKQGTPTGSRGREKFFERRNGDSVSWHPVRYNRSAAGNPVPSLLYGAGSVE